MIDLMNIKEVKDVEVINEDLGLTSGKSKLLIMNDGSEYLENRGRYTASGVTNYYTDAKNVKMIDGKYDMQTARREHEIFAKDVYDLCDKGLFDRELASKMF